MAGMIWKRGEGSGKGRTTEFETLKTGPVMSHLDGQFICQTHCSRVVFSL